MFCHMREIHKLSRNDINLEGDYIHKLSRNNINLEGNYNIILQITKIIILMTRLSYNTMLLGKEYSVKDKLKSFGGGYTVYMYISVIYVQVW